MLAACSSHPSGGAPDAPSAIDATPGNGFFVDPVLGTDDLAHGTAPGAGAWKTITYALAHASSTAQINLADGTYDHASGETFPLALSGGQSVISGNPLGAKIVGDGAATFALGGSGDALTKVDVSTTAASGSFPACVTITGGTQHAIIGANLHGCFAAIDFGGHGGVNVTNVTTGDVNAGTTAGNCLNQAGDDVNLMSFSCKASNDWVFGCGANFKGCNTPVLGRQAACAVDTSHFADPCL